MSVSVIGVALMVGGLFFLMIAVDKTLEFLGEQWSKARDKSYIH